MSEDQVTFAKLRSGTSCVCKFPFSFFAFSIAMTKHGSCGNSHDLVLKKGMTSLFYVFHHLVKAGRYSNLVSHTKFVYSRPTCTQLRVQILISQSSLTFMKPNLIEEYTLVLKVLDSSF